MTNETNTAAETVSDALPKLRTGDVFPKGIRERYAKGKTETGARFYDSGDDLAQQLRGATLIETAAMYAKLNPERNAQGWIDFYTVDRELEGKRPLNTGMVRMNIGNRIRALLKDQQ
jgi:hypothetical protein